MLNKTAKSNLKNIAIVIGIIMLLPFFVTTRKEYRRGRGRVNESDRSKARRKAKKCKYANARKRRKMGC